MSKKTIILIVLSLLLLPGGVFAAWYLYKESKKEKGEEPEEPVLIAENLTEDNQEIFDTTVA